MSGKGSRRRADREWQGSAEGEAATEDKAATERGGAWRWWHCGALRRERC